MKLLKKILIQGKIVCKTGLHIGGSATAMSIGGNDNPVIRNPRTNKPFIPGSSLKGKMRALVELNDGTLGNQSMGNINNTPTMNREDAAARLFGNASGNSAGGQRPSRIIVRDCELLTSEDFKNSDLPYTELKTEVVIDRITSAAMPRPYERVPAGAEFSLNLVINIFDEDEDNEDELIKDTLRALNLLQDDYLGGGGSRGSGHIAFKIESIKERNTKFYTSEEKELDALADYKTRFPHTEMLINA